jgi:hypothetical protein
MSRLPRLLFCDGYTFDHETHLFFSWSFDPRTNLIILISPKYNCRWNVCGLAISQIIAKQASDQSKALFWATRADSFPLMNLLLCWYAKWIGAHVQWNSGNLVFVREDGHNSELKLSFISNPSQINWKIMKILNSYPLKTIILQLWPTGGAAGGCRRNGTISSLSLFRSLSSPSWLLIRN